MKRHCALFFKFTLNPPPPQFRRWKHVWSSSEAELIFLLFYLLNWVSDTIIVVVKYGSNEHVHPISLSGVLLHQCSLKVTPYSWDREIGEGGRKERDMGIWEWDGSWSVFRTGLAWFLFSDRRDSGRNLWLTLECRIHWNSVGDENSIILLLCGWGQVCQ